MTSRSWNLPYSRPDEEPPVWLDRQEVSEIADWARDLVANSRDLLCVHDLEGRLLWLNPVPARLLGYTVEEILKVPMRELIDPKFAGEFDQYLREIARVGEASGVMAVRTRSGERRLWEYHNTLRSEGLEKPIVRGIAHDVTERIKAEKALREAVGRLQEHERVVENLDEMIVVLNRDYHYVLANRAFLTYRGLTKEQVIGHHTKEVLDPTVFEEIIKPRLEECFSGKVVNYELKYTYPELGERDLAISYLPIEGPGGIDRAACVLRDITEHKRAEDALRESEERLHLAQEAAGIGTFERNFLTGECRWTRQMEKVYGLPPGDYPKTFENFMELIHPEDRQRVSVLIAQSLEIGEASGEWRVIWPDGTVHWISGRWRIFKDAAGKPARAIGMDFDITERKRVEEALRTSERVQFEIAKQLEKESARLIEAQAVAKVGSWEVELPSLKVSWSEQTHRIFETDPFHFRPTRPDFVKLIHPEDRAKVDAAYEASLEKHAPSMIEYRIILANGSVKVLEEHWKVFHNEQGQPVRLMGTCQDITERERIEEELRQAKEKLTEEKLYLEHAIDSEMGFEEIVGTSKGLRAVMEQVTKVAVSDATVLLLGETGVGKELVARAIHRLSLRNGNSFIKMNCAAIPSGLLESELFGAEKGAFTGAVSRKIGRLELADKGTIFLDEIGEISLALQPKLLRVIQDQEFERLGGTKTLKVDFRVIAATNRDLAESVRMNEFRRDLYYRLNVFPIRVPALRERPDDIPLLVEHFVQKCARRLSKVITSVPKKTMDALVRWPWPGNIRELENFIERSVILTHGSVLAAPLSELQTTAAVENGKDETLDAAERRHILTALRQSHGRISGRGGAAERLGLKRTTLQSKLKQMGINPHKPQA